MSNQQAQELMQVLDELRQLDRELVEQRYLRRSDGVERIREALRRLGEVRSPAGIIERSAEELGTSADFDLVLVTRIQGEQIRPLTLWSREGQTHASCAIDELRSQPTPLHYPLTEAEAAQRHEGLIVSVASSERRAAPYLADALKWHSYAIATIILEGNAVGLLHAGRTMATPAVDEIDLELAVRYANGLAAAFERATLREQLLRQRAQLGSAAQWINTQVVDLSQRTKPATAALASPHDGDLADLLTPRELEVMRLIAQGQSNRTIAISLLLGEGTIKYHIKNIFRKLQARRRSEAISRFVRLYGEGESS